MKKVFIQLVQPDPDGPVFARIIKTAELLQLQDYAHDHTTRITKDMLVAGAAAAQVAGFGATLTGLLKVSIAVGNIVDANGVIYELDAAVEKTLNPADVALPRIDLIYATLAIDAEAATQFMPFRRLRTPAEIEAGMEPYPEVQYNVPTELQTLATINVRAGAPNAAPVAPALNAGEVPLWHVHVAAGQTVLGGGDLTDFRPLMESLYALSQRVTNLIVGSTSIVATPAGNTVVLTLHTTYKTLLDNATSAATASTIMKRDANADVQTRDFKPTRQILFPDSSLHRAAFIREAFINLIEVNSPVGFHGAATGVYETVKRVSAASVPDAAIPIGSVNVAPEFDFYMDPADVANVSFKFEGIALHTATQPPGNAANVWGSTLQLWNATDAVELAAISWTWLETEGVIHRSSSFSITGSGVKRLVVRAKNNTDNTNALFEIWRARLIVNPSF